MPEAVAIVSCRPEELRYFPQGSATGMTLLLRDRRGRERSLTVGTFTGLSRVDAAHVSRVEPVHVCAADVRKCAPLSVASRRHGTRGGRA